MCLCRPSLASSSVVYVSALIGVEMIEDFGFRFRYITFESGLEDWELQV